MAIEELIEYLKTRILDFLGARESKTSFVFRNNTNPQAIKEGGAYFGFIHPEEEPSGPYHDFCVVIFPSEDSTENPWLLSLGVGSMGFRNDFDLSTKPGFRRLYESIITENGFCKTDFSDLDIPIPMEFQEKIPHLEKTLDIYNKVLPVCEILEDPLSENSKDKISAFLAIYAKARGWLKYSFTKDNYQAAMNKVLRESDRDEEEEVLNLLKRRKYVILTGAPGTGKTRLARIMQEKLEAKPFFIQFHAETDYSDFIYGIIPSLDHSKLSYTEKFGTFHNALKYALDHPNENILLIVDEINRANLSNILGPIFYLFEYRMDDLDSDIAIDISPKLEVGRIPDNFFMVATMNTADRSLAVVDFALRRRFAWYNMQPKIIDDNAFHSDFYSAIKDIFFWHASSDELSLQPGQGYFFADSKEEMNMRLKYELLPLIREYLQEQLLLSAKEDFNDFFHQAIGENIFS